MFDLEKFTIKKPKPLPVLLLLDVSDSMAGEKINNLNNAVSEMINSFKNEKVDVEIQVAVITFGSECKISQKYMNASDIRWQNLQAGGNTPLGECLKLAKEIIEDKETTPSRAYRPAVILVSDGYPTDIWQEPMMSFISNGRSSKCDRMAMAIGNDADKEMLSLFLKGTKNHLFEAKDAADIFKFFKYVTMSVTMRSKSVNPNEIIDASFEEVESTPALDNKKSSSNDENNTGWF